MATSILDSYLSGIGRRRQLQKSEMEEAIARQTANYLEGTYGPAAQRAYDEAEADATAEMLAAEEAALLGAPGNPILAGKSKVKRPSTEQMISDYMALGRDPTGLINADTGRQNSSLQREQLSHTKASASRTFDENQRQFDERMRLERERLKAELEKSRFDAEKGKDRKFTAPTKDFVNNSVIPTVNARLQERAKAIGYDPEVAMEQLPADFYTMVANRASGLMQLESGALPPDEAVERATMEVISQLQFEEKGGIWQGIKNWFQDKPTASVKMPAKTTASTPSQQKPAPVQTAQNGGQVHELPATPAQFVQGRVYRTILGPKRWDGQKLVNP